MQIQQWNRDEKHQAPDRSGQSFAIWILNNKFSNAANILTGTRPGQRSIGRLSWRKLVTANHPIAAAFQRPNIVIIRRALGCAIDSPQRQRRCRNSMHTHGHTMFYAVHATKVRHERNALFTDDGRRFRYVCIPPATSIIRFSILLLLLLVSALTPSIVYH